MWFCLLAPLHVFPIVFTSECIPGQYTVSQTRLIMLSYPRWAASSFCLISLRRLSGMRILSPLRTMSSSTERASRSSKNGVSSCARFCLLHGHPSLIVFMSDCNVASFWVSILIFSIITSGMHGTPCGMSASVFPSSLLINSRGSVSAMTNDFSHAQLIWKLYLAPLITRFCSLLGAWLSGFSMIVCSGL